MTDLTLPGFEGVVLGHDGTRRENDYAWFVWPPTPAERGPGTLRRRGTVWRVGDFDNL